MRRYVLAAVAVLLVLSALALVLHDSDDGDTGVAAGDGAATPAPDHELKTDEEPTTTTAPAETPPTTAAAVVTTAVPRAVTTTTLPAIRYPKGPASPLATDKVYVVGAADAAPHEIAAGGVLDSPRWSADGRRVLVMGSGGVRSMNPDGSSPKSHPFKGGIATPAWSSTGQLAGVVIENGSDYHLGITLPNGSMRQVKAAQVGPVSGAAWSPDGGRVAFAAGGRVWVAKADGTGAGAVTAAGSKAWRRLAWSPDGGRIAFYGGKSVQVVNADGSGLRTVAAAAESAPSWSPDGKRLAFTGPESSNFALVVAAADGSGAQAVGGVTKASSPAFSPDGSTLVFSGGGHTVETIRADGSARRTLLGPTDVWFGVGIAWSPDGTHLLVNTGGGGEGGPSEPM